MCNIILNIFFCWSVIYVHFSFSKEVYNKEAVLRAAYAYTDRAFVHLDANEKEYLVTIRKKQSDSEIEEAEFQNEVLAQMVRQYVRNNTKNVRELMLARAFASTLIEEEPMFESDASNYNIKEILTDWFDKYE